MKLQDIKKKGFYWNLNNKKIIYEVYQNTLKSWLEERPQDDLIVDVWEYDYTEDDGSIVYETDAVSKSREFCPYVEVEQVVGYTCSLIDESGFVMVRRKKEK